MSSRASVSERGDPKGLCQEIASSSAVWRTSRNDRLDAMTMKIKKLVPTENDQLLKSEIVNRYSEMKFKKGLTIEDCRFLI